MQIPEKGLRIGRLTGETVNTFPRPEMINSNRNYKYFALALQTPRHVTANERLCPGGH